MADPCVVFMLVGALSVVGPDIGFGVSPFHVGLVVKVGKVESAIIVGVSLLAVYESSVVCVVVALSTFRDTCVVLDTSFAVMDVCVVGPVFLIGFGVSCIKEGVTDVT